MILLVRIVKDKTQDGLMELTTQASLGQEFMVDKDTQRTMQFQHIDTGIIHEKEMIRVYPPFKDQWLPVELLEWLGTP